MKKTLLLRLFLLFVLFVVVIVLKKLLQEVEIDDEKESYRWVLLFPVSVYVLFSIFYTGNAEIIGVLLFLCSLKLILQEKTGAYFIAIPAIAVSPAYFLLYVIIILLWEKSFKKILIKIMISGGVGLSGYLFLSHFVFLDTGYIIWSDTMSHGLTIIGGNNMSVVVVAFFVIAVISYTVPVKNKKKVGIYYLMSLALIITVFSSYQGYYMVMTIPLLLLVFCQNKKYERTNMLLYLVYSVCGIICMLWNEEEYVLRRISLQVESVEYLMGVVAACLVAAAVLLIVVNNPFYKVETETLCRECENWIKWIVAFAGVPFLISVLL